MNYLDHSDFCGWHEDQLDKDCTCGHVKGVDLPMRGKAQDKGQPPPGSVMGSIADAAKRLFNVSADAQAIKGPLAR